MGQLPIVPFNCSQLHACMHAQNANLTPPPHTQSMQDLLLLILNKALGSKLMVVRPGYPLGAGFGDYTPEAKAALFAI